MAYAHTEDLYPNYPAILKREAYITELEKRLKNNFNSHFSLSLFGVEMEHILIVSPSCVSLKNYLLTQVRRIGIMSCTCRWHDDQLRIMLRD